MKIRNVLLNKGLSLIASLPFGFLYAFSDFLYILIYYFIGYRKRITFTNLSNSFPNKSGKEIKKIAKQYYRNLSDLFIEVIKSQKMTPQQLNERVQFNNPEILDEFYDAEKNVFAALGHYGNWEWVGNKIGLFLKHEGAAVYKPFHNTFFDDYMVKQRQKYKNTLMIDYKKVFRTLVKLKDKLYTVFVLADQSPARTEMDYFVDFLGRKTAFYRGMEKVARALNYAVIYLDIQHTERGFYQVEIKIITKDAAQTKPGEITKEYVRLLEQTITRNPDNWLWSHRRWKE